MSLSDADRLALYAAMCLSRAVEDAAWALSGQGRLVGRLYTGHGQEAIPVGTAYALGPDDVIAPMYRDMGAHLVRGIQPVEVFSQYMGKRPSSNAGKDSGLHMGDMARGIVGMISVLPDSLPVTVGIALAFQIRGEPRVALTYFGDGSTSTGAFHEAINFAAVQKVPAIFICENNQWALSTPNRQEFAAPSLAKRAAGYGLPAVQVDGNDVEAVHAATVKAVARARRGEGPSFIECVTMRMRGHSIIDGAEYVPREQLAEWAERDPIVRYRAALTERGLWDEAKEAALIARQRTEIDAAIAEALAMPDPEPGDVYTRVFAEPEDAAPAPSLPVGVP